MEYASCKVRLGGDIGNEILKNNVTPSEVMLLRVIHGDGAVHSIEIQGQDRRAHNSERDRLQSIYGATPIEVGGEKKTAYGMIFPSVLTPMPVSFRDAGIETIGGELPELPAGKTAGQDAGSD